MPRREPRDTGFPEPFCSERNTTLPHPEADLSPNAWIGSKEVTTDQNLRRAHRSFIHRRQKHNKTLGHGVVAPSITSTGSELSLQPTRTDSATQPQPQIASPSLLSVVETNQSPRPSGERRDSFVFKMDGDTPPTSPEQASIKSSRSMLSKWRRK